MTSASESMTSPTNEATMTLETSTPTLAVANRHTLPTIEMNGRPPGWLQDSVVGSMLTKSIESYLDVTLEGLSNVPTTEGVILCPNHLSFIDSPLVMALVPRRVLAIGKGEYMNDWYTRYTFPALGMMPIDRSGGTKANQTLNEAAAWVASGEALLIYPEGTRTRDGKLHRGRTGPVRLALRAQCPIVPVGIEGTDKVQPIDSIIPKRNVPCTLRFGEPLDIPAMANGKTDRRTLRALTDELMFEICDLSGQEYIDEYQ